MALYHTHRPQTFAEVTGQEHIVKTIENQVKNGTVAHAYLFSGPRGVGKTTTARLLAKAVNCLKRKDKESKVCNACDACTEISGGRSIDVIEIDAASHTGVDNVRENIIENAQFKPTKLKHKVFIIDEVHMLSGSAFNALLKTLEEPPEHVIFILATTEKHKLPETIISRCQRFDFKKVGYETMKKHLEKIAKAEGVKVDKDVVGRIINKSDGCVRDAVSLLDQLMATGEKTISVDVASIILPTSNVDETLAFTKHLIEKDAEAALNHIATLVEDGTNLPQFAHDVIELLRILLVTKSNPQAQSLGLDLSDSAKKELQKLQDTIDHAGLVQLIDILLRRRAEIKSAPIPQLPLELAVIEWCKDSDKGEMQKIKEAHSEKEPAKKKSEKADVRTTPELSAKKENRDTSVELSESKAKPPDITQTTTEPVDTTQEAPHASFALDDAKSAWQKCIAEFETQSPSLVFILKSVEVTHTQGNTICTQVQYTFHRDKLLHAECKHQIESMLANLIGSPITLDVAVAQTEAPATDELHDLAAAFGGEVVG